MIGSLFRTAEFKVGVLVLVAASLIAVMALRSSQNRAFLGGSKDAWFLVDDASGLVKNSAVKMAGIDVGTIKDIKLQNGRARVEMVIRSDTPATKSARIEIRPNGILGDKHIEIVPGQPEDPPLRSGDQILIVDDKASIDKVLQEVGKITKNLTAITENLKDATEGDTDKPLGQIVSNLQQITNDFAELSREHKEDIGQTLANLREISDNINDIVSEEGPSGLKSRIKLAMERLDNSMKNIEDITGKINRGEGTIGKLVSDEDTAEKVQKAVDGISNLVDTANKTETSFDFHYDYMGKSDDQGGGRGSKTFVSIFIQPGVDRYYELGVVSDNTGYRDREVIVTTQNGVSTTSYQDTHWLDHLKITALFAKNFYNVTLKAGIIESTGGAGVDWFLFNRRLRLSAEVYDLVDFRVRATARYTLFHGIYLQAGEDTIKNTELDKKIPAVFVGGGITLTNDDLKLLLSKAPL